MKSNIVLKKCKMAVTRERVTYYFGIVVILTYYQIGGHPVSKFTHRSSKFFPDFSCYSDFSIKQFERVRDRCRIMQKNAMRGEVLVDREYFKCCILRVIGFYTFTPPKSFEDDAQIEIGSSNDNDTMVQDFTNVLSGNHELAKNISTNVIESCNGTLAENQDRTCVYWFEIYECVFLAVKKFCPDQTEVKMGMVVNYTKCTGDAATSSCKNGEENEKEAKMATPKFRNL